MNNKNNSNYDHFLTPNERVFYARHSIDGTQQIIDEMWKVIKNPKGTSDRKMIPLELAFEGTKSKIEMLKIIKKCIRICILLPIMIMIMGNR